MMEMQLSLSQTVVYLSDLGLSSASSVLMVQREKIFDSIPQPSK